MHAWWLRWVLLCTAFSALHGLLGAWVVPAVVPGTVTEICTPHGLQWVAVDSAPSDDHPAPWPKGLAQPCVWASAHVSVPLGLGGEGGVGATVWPPLPGPLPRWAAQSPVPDNAWRVLLMSPMRAPPA